MQNVMVSHEGFAITFSSLIKILTHVLCSGFFKMQSRKSFSFKEHTSVGKPQSRRLPIFLRKIICFFLNNFFMFIQGSFCFI